MKEHIRTFYHQDRSIQSLKKISKCCRSPLILETCDNHDVVRMVKDAELQLINESENMMTGLNGMELALSFKRSHFNDIKEAAIT